ncbi:hypothetical protein [Nonomuraea jabiensis]|uniref:hypothetical protein n=1 Tax=Nonomuraea jabiensis TaxID=882448 RepID=UPI003D742855
MRQTTRFAVEVQVRGWTFDQFDFAFRRAAQSAAQQEGDPALASTTVPFGTYKRWIRGELNRVPQRRRSIVLSRLFDMPADELFAPMAESDAPTDGGQVLGREIVLDRQTGRAVEAWLGAEPATSTRRRRSLASFVRWLHEAHPRVDLLAVTGTHLDQYCTAALAGHLPGLLTPGKPLATATVTRRRRALESFFAFAWQQGVLPSQRASTVPAQGRARALYRPSLTRGERRRLHEGAAKLAEKGLLAEAVAVVLLDATGASAAALAEVTTRDLCTSAPGQSLPTDVVIRDSRGDLVAFPIPDRALPWLRILRGSRADGDALIKGADGRPVTRDWIRLAVTSAAVGGGIPERRAERLYLDMMVPPAGSPR